ncbi:(2,3-dihydroxybenzoyl)adenylate synthase [Geodermatophilus maliterrae]|uniref:(2,3-dihydroxybenzoyl)adenylate synthase n=1 Tax=Geodermatophilus maliterrae TaxID=3162531 RepID=A0ABV3XA23_9ACTN
MTTGAVAPPARTGLPPVSADRTGGHRSGSHSPGGPLGTRLAATAAAAPDRVCLVDGDVRITFGELVSRADGAALRLRALGVRPGDRVLLQLPNSWEFVVTLVACLRLGAVAVLTLPAHRRQELTAVARHSGAGALVVPDVWRGLDHQAMAHQVAQDLPGVPHVLVAGSQIGSGSLDLRALCAPAPDPATAAGELDAGAPDGAAVALLLLSGGTSGTPKLIPRTHDDLACMATRSATICRLGPGSTYLAALPLGHGFALVSPGAVGTLLAGGAVVLCPSPAPEQAFPLIRRERVTVTSVVPAVAQRWLQHALTRGAPGESLQLLQVGGARMPDDVAAGLGPALGCTVQQAFGMSEGLLCLTRVDDPVDVVRHTQGRPICPDDEVLVVDAAGQPVPLGRPGLLLTRGPCTVRGYHEAAELDREAFTEDGWYRTGDVVRIRPDGNLVVVGREKDVVNRGGEKIAAADVEANALRLPGLQAVAAVAMPHPELGEAICLYAVVAEGADVTLADVRQQMVRDGVARFALPDHLEVVDDLPLTAVGKVDKRALQAGRPPQPAEVPAGT